MDRLVLKRRQITRKAGPFQTEGGCLSLEGVRPCRRFKEIEVDYLDENIKNYK